MMLIAFGFAITRGYASPIPGIGLSFPDLIIKQSDYLASEIGQSTASRVTGAIVEMADGMIGPTSVWNVHEAVTYVVIQSLLFVAAAAIYMVIGFAIVAQAVLAMLGPVFVPFLIVPKLDWLFWGWLEELHELLLHAGGRQRLHRRFWQSSPPLLCREYRRVNRDGVVR